MRRFILKKIGISAKAGFGKKLAPSYGISRGEPTGRTLSNFQREGSLHYTAICKELTVCRVISALRDERKGSETEGCSAIRRLLVGSAEIDRLTSMERFGAFLLRARKGN